MVTGQLVFPDGPLIKAMRRDWCVSLAALNRLLNNNRQLFVTQSPAGEQDAERKRLSRAFRNRLIELHFGNLPQNELETIIEKKCQLPKSDVRNY